MHTGDSVVFTYCFSYMLLQSFSWKQCILHLYFGWPLFCCWQVYYVYGFMLLVFIILIIVTVCVTIVGTYFLLNAENYHWRWTSFFSAASTALYVYLYAIYYYHVKTKMSGFFQTSFYFGYTMMFCLGLGILCGKLYKSNTVFGECLLFSFPSKRHPYRGLKIWLNLFFLDFFGTPGAVGYLGSNLFVRRIYRNIKCD